MFFNCIHFEITHIYTSLSAKQNKTTIFLYHFFLFSLAFTVFTGLYSPLCLSKYTSQMTNGLILQYSVFTNSCIVSFF